MAADFFHTVQSLVYLLVALPAEGDGNDAYGEDIHLLGNAGDGWCRSGTRSATHTGGDEHHLRAVVQHVLHFFDAFFSGFLGLVRAVAGSQSFVSQLELDGDRRLFKCLAVGVAHHEGYVVYAFAIHVVHGIASSAAYTDDFDYLGRIGCETEIFDDIIHNISCF